MPQSDEAAVFVATLTAAHRHDVTEPYAHRSCAAEVFLS
jgi:hypothetical protein